MPLEPLDIWKKSLKAIPPSKDSGWAKNFAQWYAQRILLIGPKPSAWGAAGFVFTFNVSIFEAGLKALPPTPSAGPGTKGFADAWEKALLASTILCATGTFEFPPSPPNLASVVVSSVIDPPSISRGKAILTGLAGAPPTPDPTKSDFPEKFRNATLALTATIIGVNSVTPTPGPLIIANVPFS